MFSDIYIDESSQTKSRHLILGAVIIPTELAPAAEDAIWKARQPELPHGELKWTKVSRAKLAAYERVIDCFFQSAELRHAHFHSVVVDTSRVDHARFNDGSSEIGFNKEVFQLASKCARLYTGRLFHLYPDYRDTNQRPGDLRDILNRARRKAGDAREWPFRRCHFRDSKTTPLLWLSDLMAGAIGYQVNGHIMKDAASEAKTSLSRHIMLRAGVTNPLRDTSLRGKFTIWHRQLQVVPRR